MVKRKADPRSEFSSLEREGVLSHHLWRWAKPPASGSGQNQKQSQAAPGEGDGGKMERWVGGGEKRDCIHMLTLSIFTPKVHSRVTPFSSFIFIQRIDRYI